MRIRFQGAAVGLLAALTLSSVAMAQMAQPKAQAGPRSPWKYYPGDVSPGDGGPAPKRDLSGTWAGPGSSTAVPRGGGADKPELTPLGQQMMSKNKPIGKFSPAGTNDPHARYCDPVGFPQNAYNEARGLSIGSIGSDRVIILVQFQDLWREIWTDGRALPTNVGGREKDALDPTYNGYSTGHWEDDNTFVVETTGIDEKTWLTSQGYPHSVNAHITERYTRVDHNDLKLTVTVDDPTIYVKPWSLGTNNYKWITNQKIEEWQCIPSEVIKYMTELGDPAGSDPNAAVQRIGRAGGPEQ
jgi:hypothetical protein